VRKIDQYLLKELLWPFLMGAITVVMLSQAGQLMEEFSLFQREKAPLNVLLEYSLYKMPSYFQLALPVGVAFSSSLIFSRLARESEMTAIRMAGTPILRILFPVIMFGAFVAIGNFLVGDYLAPAAEKQARELRYQYKVDVNPSDVQHGTVIHLGKYVTSLGQVRKTSKESLEINDALLIYHANKNNITIVSSPKGTYEDGKWIFNQLTQRNLINDKLVSYKKEDQLIIKHQTRLSDIFASQSHQEQSALDLARSVQDGIKQKRDITMLAVAFHEKFSVPCACVVFAVTGPVVAMWFGRSGPFVGVLLSVFLVLAYLNVQVIASEIFGRLGFLPPVFAAWLPNLFFLTFGLLGARKVA
jgi:lipopolysaccharide export system permease protein